MASQRSVNRILMNVALDAALAAVAAIVARWIADPGGGLLHPLWFLAGGAITLFLGGLPFRLPQQYWRFSGIEDLMGVAGGSVISAGLFALLLIATGFPLPTPTFPIVHAFTLVAFLGMPRVLYRLLKLRPARRAPEVDPVLLAGADEAADVFLRALRTQREPKFRVIGLLAFGGNQTGRRMQGHPILGGLSDTRRVLDRLAKRGRLPSALVVTDPRLSGARMGYLLEEAQRHGIAVWQAPQATELQDAAVIELKPIAIEDLLNRPQVRLDLAGMRQLIEGKRVLVTGAGGSIGAELCRQLAALGPARLILLDNSEYALWQIDIELSESLPGVTRTPVIADVRDASRIASVFDEHAPDIIFHAAALKHVPMVEANPLEGLLTNAVGTGIVADAGRSAGAGTMVLISTDKAVNPTSLMGTSKRIAEIYCQALDIAGRTDGGMRCVTVRFGNVLGSTGSVVPVFRRQLERGGPLTVTHPDMQRYFMTVSEAVGLVLQACVVAPLPQGGIFVLDMGAPVKIVELAKQMIRLSGLRNIAIEYSGLRPGEKLFEELFHGHEPPVPTGHAGLLMARPRTVEFAVAAAAIDDIARACRAGDVMHARACAERLVPEFAQVEKEGLLF
jgi:O-antigen biosynthesis protein WbqV